MILVDFYMNDSCEIPKAALVKNNDTKNLSEVETKEEAEHLIKNEKSLAFCTQYVQGHLITDHIMTYRIYEV